MKYISMFLTVLCITVYAQETATWDVIQAQILNTKCVDCHYEGSSFAKQSDLILTSDVAYENLIDVEPHNIHALEDGLVRVSSLGGSPGIEKSFLWDKINVADQEHYYEDHANYGSLMPLGLPSLTNGEIKFIENWIIAGSPRDGEVVELGVLNDTTRFVIAEFKPLEPPNEGFQLHVGPVDIWSAEKHDREFLYFEPYKTAEELFMTGYEIRMRPSSHHYVVYHYSEGDVAPPPHEYRDMRDEQGNGNLQNLVELNFLFPFKSFVGTQTPYIKYTFPKGIGLSIPPGSGFDHNLHSVNRSGGTVKGEVYTNIYTKDKSEIEHIAYNGNFSNYSIELPPKQVTTLTKEFYFDEKTHIIQMWSHAHEKMTEFQIEGVGGERDGELLYWTNDWEHPPYLRLDPPMTFEVGEGVKLITTYNNWEDRTIKFGPLSSDEMQFLFYIYFTGEFIKDSVTNIKGKISNNNFILEQNYPNPFNPSTNISYTISEISNVEITIYDILGNEIVQLTNKEHIPGKYSIEFNSGSLSNGIYFYRLKSGSHVKVKKMILLK